MEEVTVTEREGEGRRRPLPKIYVQLTGGKIQFEKCSVVSLPLNERSGSC